MTVSSGPSKSSAAAQERSEPLVWLKGRVTDAESARVGVLDAGLTVGDGVFETCKVADGRPFAVTRHLRRLASSSAVLDLPAPDGERIREGIGELLEAAGDVPFARLRITVTSGLGLPAGVRGDAGATLVISLTPCAPWPVRGAAITVDFRRNEHSATAGAKTISYAENVVAARRARAVGAHEALMANTAGMLCEGTGSNVLVDLGEGRLVTPPLTSGCLAGITRELLLEWAGDEGLPIAEQDLPFEVLSTAQDVLLTSSTRDVQQVADLDGRSISGTELGRAAVDLFARRAANVTDP